MTFPECECLELTQKGPALFVTFNRPKVRNALSLNMVKELLAVFDSVLLSPEIRVMVLRGAGGHFCAGGDIKDMASARTRTSEGETDSFYILNRTFGYLLETAEQLPQVLVCALEGSVMGGGFGLACISDVALTHKDASFALPETGLGITPAQIAPFVVKRIGLTQARRLALLGEKFNGAESVRLGITHSVFDSVEEMEQELDSVIEKVHRCAPGANATTKQLMLSVGQVPMKELLDSAARDFSNAIQGPEGTEGTMAFVQKRLPAWAEVKTGEEE
ncbi:enoyl-CoA hydratase/isomerase family protein [Sansalvadorimonas sp. 2012CJ34-2]|uniref:Enoyl-CoA hydratase/isomerase family protein n=1 Tax=Parendozoicomonas callyspongiae TaxID=2942213 RepID=A0ABT0PK89_9GAMM|nr:enoyl-CoA hydratase/isomerase family protein [Sansalvadorimonas sp. 2012CJ34-2]MCL6271391.1 enoyl-CoA hydratase/isomerase family protein [Sansalvadorimonas sp. 2012CJ34-2]